MCPNTRNIWEQVNSSITSLSLEWNNIGTFEQGIQRLADGLEVNGCLTSLVLCNNHINAQVRYFITFKDYSVFFDFLVGDGKG